MGRTRIGPSRAEEAKMERATWSKAKNERIHGWIKTVSSVDFDHLAPDLRDIFMTLRKKLSEEFHSEERTRKRDEAIERFYDTPKLRDDAHTRGLAQDEMMPTSPFGRPRYSSEDWKEYVVTEIEQSILRTIIKTSLDDALTKLNLSLDPSRQGNRELVDVADAKR